MKKFLIAAILALILSGCRGGTPSNPAAAIETSAGKEFKLVIDSNPTTGYHWEIVGDLDKNIVEFVSKDYRPDTPQRPGSGGVDIWVFKAVGPGETKITLGYYPPSNNATEPAKIETFTVKVK